MSVIAFLPARGGSKSIPKKNIKNFCGKPLIFWSLSQLQSSNVEKIIVATDCMEIKNIVNSFNFSKVSVFNRSAKNSNDLASTESVILEYINTIPNELDKNLMLVQATTPFTQTIHFNESIEMLNDFDSILSCCHSKRFHWDFMGNPINYDVYNRPRRQDFQGNLVENGAIYISKIRDILKFKNRISGRVGMYIMPEYTNYEIDEVHDWKVAESIMKNFFNYYTTFNFSKIKLFLSDVDGVLTDSGMYYTEIGDEMKKFCTHDGMGMQILKDNGVMVGIITSEDMEINKRRSKKLNLDFSFHGVKDKLKVVKELCVNQNISLDEVAYIGDDINCFKLLCNVGFPACPKNAVDQISSIPNIIKLNKNGGEGVVREFIDIILSENVNV
tara:strand:+ start:56060 stop:57217 length:1158 start_codon:yes stop_codon:yes gene_type:complete